MTAPLAPLLSELERRAQAHPDELSALLSECHVAYFSARKSLLVNRLTEEIRGLDPARTELVELVSEFPVSEIPVRLKHSPDPRWMQLSQAAVH